MVYIKHTTDKKQIEDLIFYFRLSDSVFQQDA